MKETYIDMMETCLSAYSDEHILRYFDDVKRDGLTEHGFPRLTANMGILISRGRRTDLLPIFLEMMDFCCHAIPNRLAANDFSVREIVACLLEVEAAGIVPKERTDRWRAELAAIDPTATYNRFVTTTEIYYRNWVMFTAVSEFFRFKAGIGGSLDFIELQILQQLQWFDKNGMYGDDHHVENHQPIVYDLVPRGLLCILLGAGYRGAHYEAIEAILKKSARFTLSMQSPNGEIPYGGRSNQFLHNEAWLSIIFEHEAKRYAREGDPATAAVYKAATERALSVIRKWLSKTPIRHIKNRFPTETTYGCEGYAYFDKYMITAASFLYAAYSVADGSLPCEATPDLAPSVAMTEPPFHKLFLKAGGYGLEFDTDADPHYDASGLGRIHRAGAPAAICLSLPCPADPLYTLDVENPISFSLCSALKQGDEWLLGANTDTGYEALSAETDSDSASASLLCRFPNGRTVKESYRVDKTGVSITLTGEGELGFGLPAFSFDGESSPEIRSDPHTLTVSYEGWLCRYTTDGSVTELPRMAANRNGHYRPFLAVGKDTLRVRVEIFKE